VGAKKVPDAKTLARIEVALGPEVFQKVQSRIVGIAREKKAVEGRKMRLDTTVTETNIHYPTDRLLCSLAGDSGQFPQAWPYCPGRAGRLQRILFNEDMEELRREVLLADQRLRIRDVRQGPDELLYLLMDTEDGAVLRIEPVP
jgi:hypothetical protein